MRRTMMFVPGNNPQMLQSVDIYGSDAIILDLEDAVSITEKDTARILVRNAIQFMDYSCEVAVRINHINTPFGYDDLHCVLAAKPGIIRLPKAESADEIKEIDDIITQAERKYGFPDQSIKMMAAIESARGLVNANQIAAASPRMVALAIGGEDFIADMRTSRSKDGVELLFARTQIVIAARLAGIQAIDTVFADIHDQETFIREVKLIKQLGFDGKSVVHPSQVKLVHTLFAPTRSEVEHARKVLVAYQEALRRQSGVIAVDGKMIDGPIVTRAERTVAYAEAVGMNTKEDSAQ